MKAVDCRIVTREIDELESGQQPRLAVREHMQICASCLSFHDDRVKLRQMVGGLGAVEAPGDFDFRLRARLANERAGGGGSRSPYSMFGFGLPSIAFATVALLVGGGLLARALIGPAATPVAQTEITRATQPAIVATGTAPLGVREPQSQVSARPVESSAPKLREGRNGAAGQSIAAAAANRTRVATKDFGSNPAVVVKRENGLTATETASTFPLEASEPLRLSIDYADGGTRTISLPALSFGSQQVVARSASMTRTSARGAW